MAKRKRLGLIFSYDEAWVAGSYYISNLIQALNTLSDQEKPHLSIFSYNSDEHLKVQHTNYPYLSFHIIKSAYDSTDLPFWKRILNKLTLQWFQTLIFDERPRAKALDICFPNPRGYFFEKLKSSQKIFWIPDFQEHYLPQFFSEKEIRERKAQQKELSLQAFHIIFSSRDARKDFSKIYPDHRSFTYVLNFAVTHPEYESLNLEELKAKFDIREDYFFSPNQFWAHKNQMLILQALKIVKARGQKMSVVFTGKEYDYRNPKHFESIQAFARENQLEDFVRFLGFIDRKEQLKLMKESLAVIQPSLFEGWSTVVEDAKAMNKYLLLSALDVHKEQIAENVTFFDPHSPEELADCLIEIQNHPPTICPLNYQINIQKFAEDFMNIVTEIINLPE